MIQRQPVSATPRGRDVAPELVLAARLAVRLSRCTARLLPRFATAAMDLSRIEGWKALGFTDASDFARERLDRSGSWLRQLARLGRACRELPALADAITGADGGKPLGRAAAYEVCRVARSDNVTGWIQRARRCTIRELKEAIRQEQDSGPSSVANTPPNRQRKSLQVQMPVFLRGAILDVERVFLATNPGSRREHLLEAMLAEYASGPGSSSSASGSGSAMIDASADPTDGGRTTRSRVPAPSHRLRVVSGTSGNGFDLLDTATEDSNDNTTNRELLQARWTLHRVQRFIESLEDDPTRFTSSDADNHGNDNQRDTVMGSAERRSSPEHIEQCLREILALERESTLRIDGLLLWLDHRRAWSLLGCADAADFGLRFLDESASTTRNRLRLARALQRSAVLRRNAESGRLSHHRLFRLVQLMQRNNLDKQTEIDKVHETTIQQWVDHCLPVHVKRLDDDLDAVERRKWFATEAAVRDENAAPSGATPTNTVGLPLPNTVDMPLPNTVDMPLPNTVDQPLPNTVGLPLPPSDAEWQASLRLVPGEARRRLLMGGLRALADDAPVNVCHRFSAAAATIRDLRHSLNLARVHLADQAHPLAMQSSNTTRSPADESRLFPSIRLAAQHVERGSPIPDWICLLSLLEEFVEEWDNPRSMPRRRTDAIAARDGWRCTAPGCTSRQIEVHHIIYRSHGGSDDPSNLTSLCPFHHRMGEHGGLLKVTGTAPLNLRWQIGNRVFMNERLIHEPRGNPGEAHINLLAATPSPASS